MTTDDTIASVLKEFEATADEGDGVHDRAILIHGHAEAMKLRQAAEALEANVQLIGCRATRRRMAVEHAVAALRFLKHCG